FLRLPLLGDILHGSKEMQKPAVSAAHDADGGRSPYDPFVLPDISLIRSIERNFSTDQVIHTKRIHGDVLRMCDIFEGEGSQLLLRITEHPAKGRICPDETKVGAGHDHTKRAPLEHFSELLF